MSISREDFRKAQALEYFLDEFRDIRKAIRDKRRDDENGVIDRDSSFFNMNIGIRTPEMNEHSPRIKCPMLGRSASNKKYHDMMQENIFNAILSVYDEIKKDFEEIIHE